MCISGISDLSVNLRPFQQKATKICQSMYSNVSLIEGPMEREKIVAALRVSGAGAWIVHDTLKRNFGKYKKGI